MFYQKLRAMKIIKKTMLAASLFILFGVSSCTEDETMKELIDDVSLAAPSADGDKQSDPPPPPGG